MDLNALQQKINNYITVVSSWVRNVGKLYFSSTPENVEQLKKDLLNYTHDKNFKKCRNMGEILEVVFDFVVRNYESANVYIIK